MVNKNPIIVEVILGEMVESRRRIHGVVCDALCHVIHGWGNLDLSIYPRSAIKSMHALPLIEIVATDTASASDAKIALACASHNGKNHHVDLANNWLKWLGVDHTKLEYIG